MKSKKAWIAPTITGYYIKGVFYLPEQTRVENALRVPVIAVPVSEAPKAGKTPAVRATKPPAKKVKRMSERQEHDAREQARRGKDSPEVKMFLKGNIGKAVRLDEVFIGKVTGTPDMYFMAHGAKGKNRYRECIPAEAVPQEVKDKCRATFERRTGYVYDNREDQVDRRKAA